MMVRRKVEPLAGLTDRQCKTIEAAAEILFVESIYARNNAKRRQMMKISDELRLLVVHSENTTPEEQ